MAAINFAELIGQVSERLGLQQAVVKKLGKAVGSLDLSDVEVERLQDAVNIELARIYAERHMADTMHRVKHDTVEKAVLIDHWEVGEPTKGEAVQEDPAGQHWVNRPRSEVQLSDARDACPDCGRLLLAAREEDAPLPVLICSRLAGLKIDLPHLTHHDIVACGLER